MFLVTLVSSLLREVVFISNDRFAIAENNTMKRIPWSTPLKNYKEFCGYNLAGYADAIYNYPEGDLCYRNFRLTNIEYNCKEFE
jgi:UDP-galactopyranose mutase